MSGKITVIALMMWLGVVHGQQMLKNHDFKRMIPATTMMEALKKSDIHFSGELFPEFWWLNGRDVERPVEVSFNRGIQAENHSGTVILSARNYRIPVKAFREDAAYRLELNASGKGGVVFGFYCYGGNGKFLRNIVTGNAVLNEKEQIVGVNFRLQDIPGVEFLVPYFHFDGGFKVASASLLPMPLSDYKGNPLTEFSTFSSSKKQQMVLGSNDLSLLMHAARDKDLDVRNRACYKLGELGEQAKSAIPLLAENVECPFEPVRVQACVALTKLGPEAYPVIREILLGPDKGNRLTMATAVRGMPGGVPSELASEVDWANPPVMQTGTSLLPDGSFEGASAGKLVGWEVLFKDGATGSWEIDTARAQDGLKSLRLTKTNGLGYVMLRSTQPVIIPPGRDVWTFRCFFQAFDAKYNTLLLPRLETEKGTLLWDDTGLNRSAGWQSQSLLRNTAPQFWDRRMIMFRQRQKPQRLRPALILYGNPATVWIDNVEFPAPAWKAATAGPVYPQPEYTLAQALDIIKKRPPVSAVVTRDNGKTALFLNGKKSAPVLYLATRGSSADFKAITQDGGIKLPVCRLDLFGNKNYPPFDKAWNSTGQIDFSGFFETLEFAIRQAPDASIILGLNIAWPTDYVDNNPDEAWMDEKGRRGWGNPMHLRGFADKLPAGNPDNPNIWWVSQYSEKAFAEAESIIRRFLVELKSKPYAGVIAGVFISGGHDGQFMIHKRDYSPACLKQWRSFLTERYGNDAALSRAWRQPGAKIADARIIPDAPDEGGDAMFFAPSVHRPYADFKEFEERQIWKNSERFARVFKEVFGKDKIALTWCMGGGWRKNFSYFFKSPYLDAFVGQPSYENRYPGSSGGFNAVFESCSYYGKLAVAELDTRNWMRGIYNELVTMRIGTPVSADHFIGLIMKEAGQMIARYQGYWFFDIGQNAYRHPDALEAIRKTTEAAQWIEEKADTDRFTPDVALVFHQPSIYWEKPWAFSKANFPSYLIDYQIYQMRLSGVPFCSYYLKDIMERPEFQKHKVYVFLNCFLLTDVERKFIREKLQRDGKVLVWNYAPGYLSDEKISVDGISEIIGMRVRSDDVMKENLVVPVPGDSLAAGLPSNMGVADAFRRRFTLSPQDKVMDMFTRRFRIEDPQVSALGKYQDDGSIALAVRRFADWTSVYSAQAGGIDTELFHNIAAEAGAYTVTRPGLMVNMNGNFLSIHAFSGGRYQVKLPRQADVFEVGSGRTIASGVMEFSLEIEPGQSQWFLLKQQTQKHDDGLTK